VRLLFAVIGAVLLAAPALRAQQMRTLDSGFTEGLGKEEASATPLDRLARATLRRR
jgi:hypothetical protein